MWLQWQALRDLPKEFGLEPDSTEPALLRMNEGAAELLLAGSRDPAEVMDMIPVKPLAEVEPDFVKAYRERLVPFTRKSSPGSKPGGV